MSRIEWKPKAAKQLRKLDKPQQVRIRDGVETLQDFPNCRNVKTLTNHQYDYRLRIGHYRIFFEFDNVVRIITIEEVKRRDERTY